MSEEWNREWNPQKLVNKRNICKRDLSRFWIRFLSQEVKDSLERWIEIRRIRRTYLNAIFRQISLDREHFSGINIGIVGVFEGLLQFVELKAGEDCPNNNQNRQTISLFSSSLQCRRSRRCSQLMLITWRSLVSLSLCWLDCYHH